MHESLINLKNRAIGQIIESKTGEDLENLRSKYLGKNGLVRELTRNLGSLPPSEKAGIGETIAQIKLAIEEAILTKLKSLANLSTAELDDSLPGILPPIGHLHPVSQAIESISSIFEKIGFIRVRYPEVDWDWYAFESLNMQEEHPARDEWETFFVDTPAHPRLGKMVLTPHTSNGQVREMENTTPPIRMINIAKCYRRQSDVSHTPMFHQFEGLVIDKNITISHLKWTIDHFTQQFFGPSRVSRLRPYHFQFTEPSFEVDVTCDVCSGRGCRLCKEGYLELGGAGMVHPNVLTSGKIDPEIYSGFAFGWGVERTYMMKSGVKIPDLRLMYQNDLRFLTQF